MIPMLNRVALLVRPRQPFVDWVHATDPTARNFDLEYMRDEPEVFLLPERAGEDLDAAIEERWSTIFEQQLGGWWNETSAWPRKRTVVMFREWFELELGSPVWDLGDEPLETESLRPEVSA